MMIRIVKMEFRADEITTFLRNFNEYKERIRAVEGCERLELLRDIDQPAIFMTYSYWKAPMYLEAYRHSDLFREVWSKTKPLFSAKPQAWSVEQKVVLD